MKMTAPQPSDLASEVAARLRTRPLPASIVLARRDSTAIAAADVWNSAPFREVRETSPPPSYVESDSHTFARSSDAEALLNAVLGALPR